MTKQQLRDIADKKYNKVYQRLIKLFNNRDISYNDYSQQEHTAWEQKVKVYEDTKNDK